MTANRASDANRLLSITGEVETTARPGGRFLPLACCEVAGSEPLGGMALGAGAADVSDAVALWAPAPAAAAGVAAGLRAAERVLGADDVLGGAGAGLGAGGREEGFGAAWGAWVEGSEPVPVLGCLKSSVTQIAPPASTTPMPT